MCRSCEENALILTIGAGGIASSFYGIKIPKWQCDVRDRTAVLDVIGKFKPAVVIVTAGISNPDRIENAWHENEINVNLVGSFNVAQAAIQHHVKTMIFIASVAGLHGKPGHAAYSASKAGVISLVQSLGHEGFNAYSIAPGRVNTKMRSKDYPLDVEGSRLEPSRIWEVVQKCIEGYYTPGDCIMVRKIGLERIVEEVVPTPWHEELRVGLPVTI